MDLGVQLILKPKERLRYWRLFGETSGFHTNNVGLAKHDTHDDAYLFSEIGVRYERKLFGALSAEATVRQGLFRYDEFRQQDFENLNAGAGLGYELKKLWGSTLFTRYNFERLTNDELGNELFRNHTISVGLQKSFTWKGSNSIYVGYVSIFGFAEPSASERDEHALFAGAQMKLTQRLAADLYYRLALFDYHHLDGRHDLNQTLVGSLTYYFTQWLSLNASVSYAMDRSNQSRFDYNAITTGGGLALKFQF